MANPAQVLCRKNVWTKVATNVTGGFVKRANKRPNLYLETYRTTGQAAPTLQDEGMPCFIDSNTEEITATAGIDVYIMAVGKDGKVRVDLP